MRAMTWPALLSALAAFLIASLVTPTVGQDKSGTLRFGVGPLQPTPTETKKAYEPFFAYLAKQLDRDFDLVATTDWAGIAIALANRQVDLAWMGPWGYILAHDDSDVRAIATAKYDGKPIYHAIVVCQPGTVKGWPDGLYVIGIELLMVVLLTAVVVGAEVSVPIFLVVALFLLPAAESAVAIANQLVAMFVKPIVSIPM